MNKDSLVYLATISAVLSIIFSILFLHGTFILKFDPDCPTYGLVLLISGLAVTPITAFLSWVLIKRIIKHKLKIKPKVCYLLYVLDNVKSSKWTVKDRKRIWKHPFREPSIYESKFYLTPTTAVVILVFVSCVLIILDIILCRNEIISLSIACLIVSTLLVATILIVYYWLSLGEALEIYASDVVREFIKQAHLGYDGYFRSEGWTLRREYDSYKIEYEKRICVSPVDQFMADYSENKKLRKSFNKWLETGRVS